MWGSELGPRSIGQIVEKWVLIGILNDSLKNPS